MSTTQRWKEAGIISKYTEADRKIAAGYRHLFKNRSVAACDAWLEAWDDIKALLAEENVSHVADLEDKYRWTEMLCNYVQELEQELWNAGLKDTEYFAKRLIYSEELHEHIKSGNDFWRDMELNNRTAVATSLYGLGRRDECDAAFERILAANPQWGYGYVEWAFLYTYGKERPKGDYEHAAKIIEAGLEETGASDYDAIVAAAADIYEKLGDEKRAAEQRDALKRLRNKTVTADKVGRNDPCPCGSGKKYKKCHGA